MAAETVAMETMERKKKSGALKQRMRSALAKLGRPKGRHLGPRGHVTDDAQVLVTNEQQPEIELVAPSKPEIVSESRDRPTTKKSMMAKLRRITARMGRHKSTSGSASQSKRDQRECDVTSMTQQEVAESSLSAPSCSGQFESDLDRLIEVDIELFEPDRETDEVISGKHPGSPANVLHHKEPPEMVPTSGEVEKLSRLDESETGGNFPRDKSTRDVVDVTSPRDDSDDVTDQPPDSNKHHRKRKRAKRYAKQAGVTAWKGLRTSWKFLYSGLVVLTTSPAFTMNATSGIAQAWHEWNGTSRQFQHRPPTTTAR